MTSRKSSFNQAQAMQDALGWLESRERFGMKLDLENIRALMEELGNPHEKLKVVHIAGTNGKGSASAMIQSILREAGYTVGLYTSPHLVSVRERIQKNGEWITEDRFVRGMDQIREITARLFQKKNIQPTYFEILTALAFQYFYEESLDFSVLETGMGGRLDSTNLARALVCVITNIDLEHTRILGKTVEEIAREKAGIIKNTAPVVTAAGDSALAVIDECANSQGARLIRLGKDLRIYPGERNLEGQRFTLQTPNDKYEIFFHLLGAHQLQNCALAVGAVEALVAQGYPIGKNAVIKGLENACWPGRFQVLKKDPWVIADAAHNPAAVRVLVRTWQDYFGREKCRLIFSALEDKDVQSMAGILSPVVDEVFLMEVKNRRARKWDDLKNVWEQVLPPDRIHCLRIEEMIDMIEKSSSPECPILMTGSIFLLGEIFDRWSLRF